MAAKADLEKVNEFINKERNMEQKMTVDGAWSRSANR